MTPKEFKAWFEGFTEAMDGQPTPAQWAKVKERVAQIDGTPTSYPVYVDRYVPRRYWEYEPLRVWSMGAVGSIGPGGPVGCRVDEIEERLQVRTVGVNCGKPRQPDVPFDAMNAMHTLGKADYQDMGIAS